MSTCWRKNSQIMISIQILVGNDIKTIFRCLESIHSKMIYRYELIVGNVGSSDGSLRECENYGATIREIPFIEDISFARNEISKNSKYYWQFYIHPWEIVENFPEIIEDDFSISFQIIRNDFISEETSGLE